MALIPCCMNCIKHWPQSPLRFYCFRWGRILQIELQRDRHHTLSSTLKPLENFKTREPSSLRMLTVSEFEKSSKCDCLLHVTEEFTFYCEDRAQLQVRCRESRCLSNRLLKVWTEVRRCNNNHINYYWAGFIQCAVIHLYQYWFHYFERCTVTNLQNNIFFKWIWM
jgi:hypothetical protein